MHYSKVIEYSILIHVSIDIAFTNYHQIQTYYQNYISSVNHTHVINYPIKSLIS
jgi:hypothetical protein